jgi:hypothetical protein
MRSWTERSSAEGQRRKRTRRMKMMKKRKMTRKRKMRGMMMSKGMRCRAMPRIQPSCSW